MGKDECAKGKYNEIYVKTHKNLEPLLPGSEAEWRRKSIIVRHNHFHSPRAKTALFLSIRYVRRNIRVFNGTISNLLLSIKD